MDIVVAMLAGGFEMSSLSLFFLLSFALSFLLFLRLVILVILIVFIVLIVFF